jgi:hypothetical protein
VKISLLPEYPISYSTYSNNTVTCLHKQEQLPVLFVFRAWHSVVVSRNTLWNIILFVLIRGLLKRPIRQVPHHQRRYGRHHIAVFTPWHLGLLETVLVTACIFRGVYFPLCSTSLFLCYCPRRYSVLVLCLPSSVSQISLPAPALASLLCTNRVLNIAEPYRLR